MSRVVVKKNAKKIKGYNGIKREIKTNEVVNVYWLNKYFQE